MQQRTKGQSLVEMALVLPLMLVVLFGIVNISYYAYGYSSVYEASRNAAEAAAQLPPFPEQLSSANWTANDPCVQTILDHAKDQTGMFPGIENFVTISYPTTNPLPVRQLGNTIQISIDYNLQPLTPLFQFFMVGNKGVFTVHAATQRSIESLGNNPNFSNGIACSKP